MTEEERGYLPLLQKVLKPERYQHSLGVMETAGELAKRYGVDVHKARLAGLLHDVTKSMNADVQRKMLDALGLTSDEGLMLSPGVWHAFTGAYYLEHELGITDPEILSMVRWHTSGRAGMTTAEKIVYVADFTEPNRQYGNVDEIRKLSAEDLDKTCLEGVAWCMAENSQKHKYMYLKTVEFYNDLIRGLTHD